MRFTLQATQYKKLTTLRFVSMIMAQKVIEEVWSLFSFAIKYIGNRVPVMIEWDTDIPELSVLIDEMKKANAMMNKIITSSKKMSAA